MDYLLIKWLHILSATILFGTGIGSAFYMFMANRQNNLHAIQFALRNVVLADWIFTTPAIFLQLTTGIMLVTAAGYEFSDIWIESSLLLFFFAGACWIPVVWIQIKMRNLLEQAVETGTAPPTAYGTLEKWWIILGSLAFPAMVAIFYLMVTKPV